MCERWVGDWTELQHIDPHPAPPAIAVRLFRSPGLLNRGPGGPASLLRAGSHCSIWNISSRSEFQLPDFLSHPRVISLFYVHSIQPVDSQGYPLISLTGCTCYLHRCISHLTAWPGRRSICNRLTAQPLRSRLQALFSPPRKTSLRSAIDVFYSPSRQSCLYQEVWESRSLWKLFVFFMFCFIFSCHSGQDS